VKKKLRAVYGTKYECGPTAETIYYASGITLDSTTKLGISMSYTLELRGDFFVVPTTEIKPAALETFEAFKCVAEHVLSLPD